MSRDEGARDERAEEQAWREIVEHYGDLPVVPDEPDAAEASAAPTAPTAPTDPTDTTDTTDTVDTRGPTEPTWSGATSDQAPAAGAGDGPVEWSEPFRFEPYDDRFVPPPLPPPPEIATDRRFAWVGLVTPPLLLLVVVALDYPLPGILTGALVVAFLASFGYLVATMSRDPRDPDDDGARL